MGAGIEFIWRHVQHKTSATHWERFYLASGSMSLELERENSRMMLSIRGIPQCLSVADLESHICWTEKNGSESDDLRDQVIGGTAVSCLLLSQFSSSRQRPSPHAEDTRLQRRRGRQAWGHQTARSCRQQPHKRDWGGASAPVKLRCWAPFNISAASAWKALGTGSSRGCLELLLPDCAVVSRHHWTLLGSGTTCSVQQETDTGGHVGAGRALFLAHRFLLGSICRHCRFKTNAQREWRGEFCLLRSLEWHGNTKC